MSKKHAPPSATGPAGPIFEAKVGAIYMLAMLKGAEARGLPDADIESVALQGAPDGNPLDDVIVHGRMPDGAPATLEIQVKRDINFSPKDKVFREVVEQIATAIKKPRFVTEVYELAVATGKVTRAITGSYQELLSRARSHISADVFFRHLNQPGLYNDDMRAFVMTLRGHLKDFGVVDDDDTVWRVLRRFQILYFDFIARGSSDEANARGRCADVLHPGAKDAAANFWDALILRTAEIAADGGGATSASLTEHFRGRFRFEGDNGYHLVRAAVADASDMALKDVATTVLGVSLPRAKQIDAIRAAIATKLRFVQIRGEAGVGKSALLKHFALEVARQGRALVLAPGRVVAGGWDAMKARLGFGGSVEAFLFDLASDGGGWLFIDNLDFYTTDERNTVNDLLRGAALVPGFVVVATARTRFGFDEPHWLDEAALAALGKAKPVLVEPIDDAELEQLRNAEPRLYALLAPDHPAGAITRNLYLLSRLLKLRTSETIPSTEVVMARTWWKNAAGDPTDATARKRSRVLRELGERAIRGESTFDVRTLDATAIEMLVTVEALSDFGNDLVAFRHDVLREWAIANVVANDSTKIATLPLAVPGTPAQLRGIELAARVALEEARNPDAWRKLLNAVSGTGSHGVWRRAILLALVHSEAAQQLIDLVSNALLADAAALLRELIPIMTAVEMRPAREMLILAPGVDPNIIPEGLNIPSSPAWAHLVEWVLRQGAKLPVKAVPEVVDLYVGWCSLSLFVPNEPLTPHILNQFKLWLMEIETAKDGDDWRTRKFAFGGAVDGGDLKRVEEDMRSRLALLGNRAPEIAKQYLTHVQALNRKEGIYGQLLKSGGSLAQAAPEELGVITLDYLRKPRTDDDDSDRVARSRREHDGALAFADKDFSPAAPSQGPFYDLLTSVPAVGLKLIRTLIDEVIAYHAGGKGAVDNDVLLIDLPGGVRRFPRINTYLWSDDSPYSSVTSAFMALEAWAHKRIEDGDDVTAVVADIIGEGEAPAVYLGVIVHVLISHWPRSAVAGVSFVGCPELLSLDLQRPMHAAFSGIDILGLGRLSKEPPIGPRLESIKQRSSRKVSIDVLLGQYANFAEVPNERAALKAVLERARARLGAYQPQDDRSVPRLMAYLALNLIDPANWIEESDDGIAVRRYMPPAAEVAHFAPLQARLIESDSQLRYTTLILRLLDDVSEASPQRAEALVAWAEKTSAPDGEMSEDIEQAILGAAMIAMRDGTPELREGKRAWAEAQFTRVTGREPDVGARMRNGIRYNVAAIAFAGRIFALRDEKLQRTDYESILRMVASDAASARGGAAAATVIDAIDARLRPSILRVAFATAVYYWHPWNAPEDAKCQSDDERMKIVEQAITEEVDWLVGRGAEPAWPIFPEEEFRTRTRRRSLTIGVPREPVRPPVGDPSYRFVNHRDAALWLSVLASRAEADKAWMASIETSYSAWTFAANGAGLPEDEDIDRPSDWNAAFFDVMTANFRGKDIEAIEHALEPIFDLQDEAFFGLTENVLFKVDLLYFNDGAIGADTAVSIRRRFAERLASSWGFRRLKVDRSTSIEIHLGPAIATVFFNTHGFSRPPSLYLPAGFIERSLPFVAVLQVLAEQAPSLFVALCTMNWVEAAPTIKHLPLVIGFAVAAIALRPDDKVFWLDHAIGSRICNWLANRVDVDATPFSTTSAIRTTIDTLLARFVTMGISEARRLEVRLQKIT